MPRMNFFKIASFTFALTIAMGLVSVAARANDESAQTSAEAGLDTKFRCTFSYQGDDGTTKYYSFETSRDHRRDSPQDICKEDLKKQTNLPVAADKMRYYMYTIL